MSRPVKRWLYWTPRIACILFAVFISVFALDVFGEGKGFWQTALALLMHLIPTFILVAVLMVSWRREGIGGILFIVLGVLYLVWAWGRPFGVWYVYLMIAGPPVLIGVLFLLNWLYRAELLANS